MSEVTVHPDRLAKKDTDKKRPDDLIHLWPYSQMPDEDGKYTAYCGRKCEKLFRPYDGKPTNQHCLVCLELS